MMKKTGEDDGPKNEGIEAGFHPAVMSFRPGIRDAALIFLESESLRKEGRNLAAVPFDVAKIQKIERELHGDIKPIKRREQPEKPVMEHRHRTSTSWPRCKPKLAAAEAWLALISKSRLLPNRGKTSPAAASA